MRSRALRCDGGGPSLATSAAKALLWAHGAMSLATHAHAAARPHALGCAESGDDGGRGASRCEPEGALRRRRARGCAERREGVAGSELCRVTVKFCRSLPA